MCFFYLRFPVHYDSRSLSYVDVPMGRIQGFVTPSPGGNHVEEYLGIPYAEPPVGDLRFADPVKLNKYHQGELGSREVWVKDGV